MKNEKEVSFEEKEQHGLQKAEEKEKDGLNGETGASKSDELLFQKEKAAKEEREKQLKQKQENETYVKKQKAEKKKQVSKNNKERSSLFLEGKSNFVMFIPIVLLLTIVPLIVFLKPVPLAEEVEPFWSSEGFVYDFFSYYKSLVIIGIAGISLILWFLFPNREKKGEVLLTASFVLLAVYVGFSLLSTITSQYQETALWGAPDRREGFVVLLSYAIICMFSVAAYRRERERKVIFWSLSLLMLVTTVIGVLQFFGFDPLQTEAARKFILPSELQSVNLTFQFEKEKIYATMFHYNYIGSFGALLAPFFLIVALFTKDKWYKVVSFIMAASALFVLFGSTSRAGVIGIVASLLFFLVVCIRQLFLHFKITLASITILAVLIAGFSMATGGTIFNRLPTLLEDLNMVGNTQSEFDYHDHIPIRQITVKGKQILFKLQNDVLIVDNTTGDINFFDGKMDYLPIEKVDSAYHIQDQRFSDFTFLSGTLEKGGNGSSQTVRVLTMDYKGSNVLIMNLNDPSEIKFYTPKFYDFEIVDAPYIGFEGREKIGSARGYIWSRSLPLLKRTMIIGFGPDTFLVKFPQGDILAKWYAYGTTNMTVDKAHNWYLQVGVNQGLIALVALLALLLLYIIDSLSLYMFRKEYNETEVFAIAILLGVVGYMGAGFFNDSVVSVAPIFWCLLGFGLGANYWVKKLRNEEKEAAKL